MFKEVEVQQGRKWVTVLEITLFAFRTEKGIFTLSGSRTNGTDTWRNITTGEIHEWSRSSVKSWWEQGKILPVDEATTLMWCNQDGMPNKNARK